MDDEKLRSKQSIAEDKLASLSREELIELFKGKSLIDRVAVTLSPVEDADDAGMYSDISESTSVDVERIVFRLNDIKIVEILVLKALGYAPKEIVEAMGFHSIATYYQLNFKLKRDYERVKDEEV